MKTPPMPRELAFLNRSSGLYHSMKSRFKEKRNKNGRIMRIARDLPFTRDQFQNWLLMKLGGKPDGAIQCRYCRVWLTAMDLGVDHLEPVSQGGGLGLDNLDLCCSTCNLLKGNLSLRTFEKLLDMMSKAGLPGEMTVADRKNLESRLKSGGVQYRFGRDNKPAGDGSPKSKQEPAKSLFQSVPDEDW